MFSWLMARKGKVPDSEIVYTIRDMRGRDKLLADLHELISNEMSKNAKDCTPTVVYLAAYIDRGPGSRTILDRLIKEPVAGTRRIHVKGNHQDHMLRFFDAQRGGEQCLSLGGGVTAMSYGVKPKVQLGSLASI